MAMVALEEAKQYIRVDSADEDEFISGLLETGETLCADVARMDAAELESHLPMARIAVLYAAAYLYEHREHADHGELVQTLRSLFIRHTERGVLMSLGEWKDKITIQKSVAGNDKAGNHILSWEDYYTCHAYVNNLSGSEYWEAAQLNAEKEIFFLIRYCSEAAVIDTEHFRIVFRGQVYNITFIDNVKYQNKTLKLRAALEKR